MDHDRATRKLLNGFYTAQRLNEFDAAREARLQRRQDESLKAIERGVLAEIRTQHLFEGVDPHDLQRITMDLDKINQVIASLPGVESLKTAVATASQQAAELLTRGSIKDAIKSLFGAGKEDILAKIMSFRDTVVTGVRQLPHIIKLIDRMTNGQLMNAAKERPEVSLSELLIGLDGVKPNVVKQSLELIQQAFRGKNDSWNKVWGKLLGDKLPYIDDLNKMAQEILELPASHFEQFTQLKSLPAPDIKVAQQIAAAVAEQPAAETAAPESTQAPNQSIEQPPAADVTPEREAEPDRPIRPAQNGADLTKMLTAAADKSDKRLFLRTLSAAAKFEDKKYNLDLAQVIVNIAKLDLSEAESNQIANLLRKVKMR